METLEMVRDGEKQTRRDAFDFVREIHQGQSRAGVYAAAGLVLIGAAIMLPHGCFLQPGTVWKFWAGAAVATLGFGLSLRENFSARTTVSLFWIVAIGARLILLGMEPGDDIWRYLWDGKVRLHGINPYLSSPADSNLAPLREAWWAKMNHRDLSASYPPAAETAFAAFAAMSCTGIFFKLAFVGADLAIVWLLWRKFRQAAILYAWNPLVLYVFAGGGHFDSLFVLPMVGAWVLLEAPAGAGASRERPWLSAALLLGLSVAVKWMSLPLCAWLVWRCWKERGRARAWAVAILAVAPLLLTWFLIFPGTKFHELAPTQAMLYARSSEFFPWVVGLISKKSLYTNQPFMLLLVPLTVWVIGAERRFDRAAETYFFGLLILSPAIHAWYFVWLLPWAVRSRNWGAILGSASFFVYFWLQQRQALSLEWTQTPLQKLLLWSPIIAGFFCSRWRETRSNEDSNPSPFFERSGSAS
ncbi:MAG: hypothetical protein JO317_02620 [Verrucomicrobiae bacterium]|nr:hypothetical protein [Verrucomicrobiae bacterium]